MSIRRTSPITEGNKKTGYLMEPASHRFSFNTSQRGHGLPLPPSLPQTSLRSPVFRQQDGCSHHGNIKPLERANHLLVSRWEQCSISILSKCKCCVTAEISAPIIYLAIPQIIFPYPIDIYIIMLYNVTIDKRRAHERWTI